MKAIIVYCILCVYGEDNAKLKNLCLILLSLFRKYNMFKLTKREIKIKINTYYKGEMININLEVLKKHVKLSA